MGKTSYSIEEIRELKDEAKQTGVILNKLEFIHQDIIEIKNGHTELDKRVGAIEVRSSAERVTVDTLKQEILKDTRGTAGLISGIGLGIGAISVGIGKLLGWI